MTRLTKLLIGGVALVAVSAVVSIAVISPSAAIDRSTGSAGTTTPNVVWNAPSISEIIKPGESKQAQVVLSAQSAIPAGTLRVVPELQPFLSVTPSTIPALAKGQTLAVTLNFSAKIDALPGTTTGTVQLRDNTSGTTIAKPLPVAFSVQWDRANDPKTGVSFSYPTLGAQGSVEVTEESDTTGPFSVFDISFAAPGTSDPEPQYSVVISPNSQSSSLSDWFRANIDPQSILLGAHVFTLSTLSNGVSVLVRTGPMPDAYTDGSHDPVADIYAISPTHKTVIVVGMSNGGSLDLSIDQLHQQLLGMLATLQAP